MQASANSRLNPTGGKNLLSSFFKKDIRTNFFQDILNAIGPLNSSRDSAQTSCEWQHPVMESQDIFFEDE